MATCMVVTEGLTACNSYLHRPPRGDGGPMSRNIYHTELPCKCRVSVLLTPNQSHHCSYDMHVLVLGYSLVGCVVAFNQCYFMDKCVHKPCIGGMVIFDMKDGLYKHSSTVL